MKDIDATIKLKLTSDQARKLQALYASGQLSRLIDANISHIERVDGIVQDRGGNVATIDRYSSLDQYRSTLYSRALHPELFHIQERRAMKCPSFECEVWLMCGGHAIRFEHRILCATELVTDGEAIPDTGVVAQTMCTGERDYQHAFPREGVTYLTTIQSETLPDNLYANTFDEMRSYAAEVNGMLAVWDDSDGRCLSLIDTQRYLTEFHVQSFHLRARDGIVIRTQTIFEHD